MNQFQHGNPHQPLGIAHRPNLVISTGQQAYNVGPPATIAMLVPITPITIVYGTYYYGE